MAIRLGDPALPFTHDGIARLAPAASGVYAICNAQGTYIYFGESADIQRRLFEHLNELYSDIHRAGAASFAFEVVEGEFARVLRQNELIGAHPTVCNQRLG